MGIMMWVYCLLIVVFLGNTAFGQTLQERARTQVETLGSISQFLTEEALNDIVVPFETATPFEASLGAGDLDDAVLATRIGDSTASQAFRATVDSATGRPSITPSRDAMGLANLAVSLGADAVADIFTGESGTCSNAFDGPVTSGTHTCSAPLSRDFRTCRETRLVSVNREDQWRCTDEDPSYRKSCSREITWRCTGTTGGACLKQALRFSRSVTWNAAGNAVALDFAGGGTGTCALREHEVQIDIEDIANITSLSVGDMTYQGVAQLRVNGQNLWTNGSGGGANLKIAARDCGKNCSVEAAYAGSTWIADCGDNSQTRTANLDLVGEFSQSAPGPSTSLTFEPVTATTGSRSNQVSVTLITANTREIGPSFGFNVSGSCCSAFTADLGAPC